MGDLYHSILPPYAVVDSKTERVDDGRWASPELATLAAVPGWQITEKIDGTNIAVIWTDTGTLDIVSREGHPLEDVAMLTGDTIAALRGAITAELMLKVIGRKRARLYLEVFGDKISPSRYGYPAGQHWRLIDANIGTVTTAHGLVPVAGGFDPGFWLARPAMENVAASLGIEPVPLYASLTTLDEAAAAVLDGLPSTFGDFPAEGVVCVAPHGLYNRGCDRIITKIKRGYFRVRR